MVACDTETACVLVDYAAIDLWPGLRNPFDYVLRRTAELYAEVLGNPDTRKG